MLENSKHNTNIYEHTKNTRRIRKNTEDTNNTVKCNK